MGIATKYPVTAANPCKICGKPDYCFYLVFENNSTVHYCARTEEDEILNGNGHFLWRYSKDTNIGEYHCYQEKTEVDAWRASIVQKIGPERSRPVALTHKTATGSKPIKGEVLVEKNLDRLDAIYSRLLQYLVLEEQDTQRLRKDWNKPTTGDLFSKVLANYPIRSLPPADWIRKKNGFKRRLISPFRSDIANRVAQEFGDISNIPGFYQDQYGWNFSGSEGIIFPVYQEGKLIRLRVRESFPMIKGSFQGEEGIFIHKYAKDGEELWYFRREGSEELVYSNSKQLIFLKDDGCPKGKAAGKYKNLSSVYEKKQGEELLNGYGRGSRSGSHYSLYDKGVSNYSVVYFTEGEKKAIIANMLLQVPVVSLPGTGTFEKLFEEPEGRKSLVEYLLQKGMKMAVIAYDADKSENVKVLNSEKAAIQRFLSKGIQISVGEWNAGFGKGLDDILVQGVRPSVYLCS